MNIGLGVYGTCSICLAVTSDREFGILVNAGGGGTTGGASGISLFNSLHSTADNFQQLRGKDIFGGASAQVAGFDVSVDKNDPSIITTTGGVQVGPDLSPLLPVEVHGGSTYMDTSCNSILGEYIISEQETPMFITYFVPVLVASYFFIRSYYKLLVVYRKKRNPDYPLLFGESINYFNKDPINFIKKLPIIPFLRWKIVFERHKDTELNEATEKARHAFVIFLLISVINFFIHVIFLI